MDEESVRYAGIFSLIQGMEPETSRNLPAIRGEKGD
jgi:hypothetical protein